MSTHKHMDKICIISIVFALIITGIFLNGEHIGIKAMENTLGYENRLFDSTRVHNIDIQMENWDKFITSCKDKKYSSCTVVIDGEKFANVAIRAKGSSSLSGVSDAGSSRYSFKLEFDHYEKAIKYHGLDKLNLNNLINDSTYMMDYLTYQMMGDFGINSPLCSYSNITVNGKKWGLYLAIEGLEDSFLQRNYGNEHGNLYKPEGSDNEVANLSEEWNEDDGGEESTPDVKLLYINDKPESYNIFFDHAKTKITSKDKKRFVSSIKQLNEGNNLEQVVDVDKVIRYFIVHNFVVNSDSYTGDTVHNYYLYEKDGKITMLPWDYNMSFGTFMDGNATVAVNTPINEVLSDRPMQSWIYSNDTYSKRYHKYYEKFLASADILNRIDATASLIAPYVENDPSKFCSYEGHQKAVNALKCFCNLRIKSIQGQLNGSIPSTSKEQLLDKSALIDASKLNIYDMINLNLGF